MDNQRRADDQEQGAGQKENNRYYCKPLQHEIHRGPIHISAERKLQAERLNGKESLAIDQSAMPLVNNRHPFSKRAAVAAPVACGCTDAGGSATVQRLPPSRTTRLRAGAAEFAVRT